MAAAVTMTGLEFDALPLEQSRDLELLDGEIIQMPSPTLNHQEIALNVLLALRAHLLPKGALVSYEVEFALARDARLQPDVCVVLPPRAAEIDGARTPIPGYPDLAVEVISPSESASTSMRKVEYYLDHGTREVWQVYPSNREVVIHGEGGQVRKSRGDEALASWLIPELAIPVSQFFS